MKNVVERHYRLYPICEEDFVPERKAPLDIDVVFELYDNGDYDEMAVANVTVDGKSIYDAKASNPENTGSTSPIADYLISLGYDFNPGGWLDKKVRDETELFYGLRKIKRRRNEIWPVLYKVPDHIIAFTKKADWSRRLDFAYMLGNDSDAQVRHAVADEIQQAIKDSENFITLIENHLSLANPSKHEREPLDEAINRIKKAIPNLENVRSLIEESQEDTLYRQFDVSLGRYESLPVTDSDRVMARLTLLNELMKKDISPVDLRDAVEFHVIHPLRSLLTDDVVLSHDTHSRLVKVVTTNEFLKDHFSEDISDFLKSLGERDIVRQWLMEQLQQEVEQYSPGAYVDSLYSKLIKLGKVASPELEKRKTVLEFLDRLESDFTNIIESRGKGNKYKRLHELKVALLQARHDWGDLDAVREALWDRENHYGIRSRALCLYVDSPDILASEKRDTLKRIFDQELDHSMKLVESKLEDAQLPLHQEYIIDPIVEWFAKNGNEKDLRYLLDQLKEIDAFMKKTRILPLDISAILSLSGGVTLMVNRLNPEWDSDSGLRQDIMAFREFKKDILKKFEEVTHLMCQAHSMGELYEPRFLSHLIQLENHYDNNYGIFF